MNTERVVVGLDIGTTKVVAVVGRNNDYGLVNVLGMGEAPSEGVERGQIVYMDKTVSAIRQAIEAAEQHANVEIGMVTVGIAGEHIRAFQQTGIITLNKPDHEITEADLARLNQDMYNIRLEPGTRIIHVVPQEYSVDDRRHIKDPVGMTGVRLEGQFHIVTGHEKALKDIERVIERAGLEIEGIVLESIASSHAVLHPEEQAEGVAMVDIGGGTTDLAIWENGLIRHTATIPFGGNIITEDIRQGCQVMRKHAETLKVKFGSAMPDCLDGEEIISISSLPNRPKREISRRTLARIIQARVEEIAEMVALEIRRSGMDKNLVGGIVVTGGGGQLDYICECFEYVTGYAARPGSPSEGLSKGLVQEVNHPIFATGTGLLIYSLRHGDDDLAGQQQTRRKPRIKAAVTPRRTPETTPAANSGIIGTVKNWFEKAMDNSSIE